MADQFGGLFDEEPDVEGGALTEEEILSDPTDVIPQEEQERQPAEAPPTRSVAKTQTRTAADLLPKPVRNFVSAAQNTYPLEDLQVGIRDTVDNLFQGDQLTPDQIRDNRQQIREDFNAKAQAADQARLEDKSVLAEVPRIVLGSVAGAWENNFAAAEWLGDLVKQQFIDEDPTQDVFSNKYEWGNWDFGKDSRGAQTSWGQLVQRFGEFAVNLAQTRGTRGLKHGAQQWRQGAVTGAKGWSVRGIPVAPTITKSQWLTLGKAAAIGGVAGIPADLINFAGNPEEGNLSNAIRDFAPEWYPTWLTAFAIDEDDSGVEAAAKTIAEGFQFGWTADAVGMTIVGARQVRKLLAQGLTENQIAAAATKELLELQKNTIQAPVKVRPKGETTDGAAPLEDVTELIERSFALEDSIGDTTGAFDEIKEIIRTASIEDQIKTYDDLGPNSKVYKAAGGEQYHFRPFMSIDAQRQKFDGEAIKDVVLPNGTRVRFVFNDGFETTPIVYSVDNSIDFTEDFGRKVLNVSWDLFKGTEIGTEGKRIVTEFNAIVRNEIEPGTILRNSPVSDLDEIVDQTASKAKINRFKSAEKAHRRKIEPKAREHFNKLWFEKNSEFAGTMSELVAYRTGKDLHNLTDDWQQRVFEELKVLNERPGAKTPWDALTPKEQQDWLDDFGSRGIVEQFKSPNTRAKIYERAGFGRQDVGGDQWAIRRLEPNANGKWLEPINIVRENRVSRSSYLPITNIFEIGEQIARNVDSIAEGQRLLDLHDPGNRLPRFNQVRANQLKGIPVTWDDWAWVFKEYFAPGARQVEADFHPKVYEALKVVGSEDGPYPYGFTLHPFLGGNAVSGNAVAIDGAVFTFKGEPTIEQVQAFISKNREVLSREDAFLGGWKEDNGDITIEIARIVEDGIEARTLGYVFDQKEIFDIDNTKSIKTFGTDSLRHTKGDHLKSPWSRAGAKRTVDATTAAAQAVNAADAPPGIRTSVQPTISQAQLKRIAKATDENVGNVLRQYVNDHPLDIDLLSEISRKSVNEILDNSIKFIGDALDVNTGKVDLSKIPTWKVGNDELLTQEGTVVVRTLLAETSQRIWELSQQVVELGEDNFNNVEQTIQMVDQLKALMKIHKFSSNTYSKLLHTYTFPIPLTGKTIPNPVPAPDAGKIAQDLKQGEEVLDTLVKKLTSGDVAARREAMNIANALLLAGPDINLQKKLWQYMSEVSLGQGLKIMYNSMLSGPATHIINTTSNAIQTVYRPLTAATGGSVREQKMAIAGFYSFQKTLAESWDIAVRVARDGGQAINDGGKGLILKGEVDVQVALLQKAAANSTDNNLKAAVGVIDVFKKIADFPLFSWPAAFLTTSDEFFKTMVARMEFHSRTMGEAIDMAAGTDTPIDELFEHLVKKNVAQNFDQATGAIKNDDLLNVAKEATFQTELDGSVRAFQNWIEKFPPARIFFPFVKTGHNIMVYTGTHVPLLNQFLTEYKSVMAGKDEYAKAVMRGREAFGRGIVIAGGLAAANGMITGNGPADPEERRQWLMTHQPRSIKLGEYTDKNGKTRTRWLDYSRIEPFGQLLSATADIYDMTQRGQLSEERGQYLAGYLTYSIASNLTKKSFYQGLVPMGQLLTPGFQGPGALTRVGVEAANNLIPLAGARRTFSNMLNPYMQEFNTVLERSVFSATGGLINPGATRYDWLTGEPITHASAGPWALMPLKYSTRGTSIVHDKLEDIEFDSADIIKTMSGIKLKPEHKSFLQEHMGKSGLYKELEKWVSHPEFDIAVEDFKTRLRNGERVSKKNQFFYRQVVRIIERYRADSKRALLQRFPELREEVNTGINQRAADRKGQVQALANF